MKFKVIGRSKPYSRGDTREIVWFVEKEDGTVDAIVADTVAFADSGPSKVGIRVVHDFLKDSDIRGVTNPFFTDEGQKRLFMEPPDPAWSKQEYIRRFMEFRSDKENGERIFEWEMTIDDSITSKIIRGFDE